MRSEDESDYETNFDFESGNDHNDSDVDVDERASDINKIDINIDGFSLARSSKLKIWPIHGAFVNPLVDQMVLRLT